MDDHGTADACTRRLLGTVCAVLVTYGRVLLVAPGRGDDVVVHVDVGAGPVEGEGSVAHAAVLDGEHVGVTRPGLAVV